MSWLQVRHSPDFEFELILSPGNCLQQVENLREEKKKLLFFDFTVGCSRNGSMPLSVTYSSKNLSRVHLLIILSLSSRPSWDNLSHWLALILSSLACRLSWDSLANLSLWFAHILSNLACHFILRLSHHLCLWFPIQTGFRFILILSHQFWFALILPSLASWDSNPSLWLPICLTSHCSSVWAQKLSLCLECFLCSLAWNALSVALPLSVLLLTMAHGMDCYELMLILYIYIHQKNVWQIQENGKNLNWICYCEAFSSSPQLTHGKRHCFGYSRTQTYM